MDLDEAVSRRDVVAGIGFRHATTAEEIVSLVRRGLDAAGLSEDRLAAFATAADRVGEAAFRAAADTFGCAALGLSPEPLRVVDDRVPTRSARMEAERGVGSLAEAAALAGAGGGGTLVLQRIASAGATCALALIGKSE